MACHLSIFAVFLLVSATTFVSAKIDRCTIGKDGKLTMFSGEEATVKFRCKYRMADFQCGNYSVKVTPGSAVGSGTSPPATVWVKIVDTTSNAFYTGRTSENRINNHIDNNAKPVWKRTGGDLQLEKEDYLKGKSYARLVIGSIKVRFGVTGDHQGVMVRCKHDSSDDFQSKDYPTSLCGNKNRTNVISSRKTVLFNDATVSDDLVILYDILNHTNVVQWSTECKNATNDFQTCSNSRTESIQTCGPIFTNTILADCLINDNNIGRFHNCMMLACRNSMTDCTAELQNFTNYVEDKCPAGTYDATFSALSCS